MTLRTIVGVITAKSNGDTRFYDAPCNVQFTTSDGVTVSVGYGDSHYSDGGSDIDRATTVEVYIWKSDDTVVKTRKLRADFRQDADGIIAWLPIDQLPSLVAHVSRYIR